MRRVGFSTSEVIFCESNEFLRRNLVLRFRRLNQLPTSQLIPETLLRQTKIVVTKILTIKLQRLKRTTLTPKSYSTYRTIPRSHKTKVKKQSLAAIKKVRRIRAAIRRIKKTITIIWGSDQLFQRKSRKRSNPR